LSILKFKTPSGEPIALAVEQVLLAGYAGRRRADVEAHAAEMRSLGVPVPASLPVFYRAMPCLLTQAGTVDVVGVDTRPEVEFVLFSWKGRRYVTVGNDQFDLAVERHGWGERSKNLCQKIVADTAWPLAEVNPHWDRLVLELSSSEERLQCGSLDLLLEPDRLVELAQGRYDFDAGASLLFSGTIPALQSLGPDTREFCMKLRDPVLGREIVSNFVLFDISGPLLRHDAAVPA
jgi:Protein of unknown function (DUF2848)